MPSSLTPTAARAHAPPASQSAAGCTPTAGLLILAGALARLLAPLPVLRFFLQPLHRLAALSLPEGRASLLNLLLRALRPLLDLLLRCSPGGRLLCIAPASIVVSLPAGVRLFVNIA